MTTITIESNVSEEKIAKIEEMIRSEQINNVSFNGDEFTIERGDFTSIDSDEPSYVLLNNKIIDIISGFGDDYE